jgi:hypothetical protein
VNRARRIFGVKKSDAEKRLKVGFKEFLERLLNLRCLPCQFCDTTIVQLEELDVRHRPQSPYLVANLI